MRAQAGSLRVMRSLPSPAPALALLLALVSGAARANADEGAAPPETAGEPGPARVLLLDLVSNGVEKDVIKTVESLLAVELSHYEALDVLSSADVRRALELETARQLAGCDEESCLEELAGALGADLVVYGDAGKLGSLLVVNLNLFDHTTLRSIGRVSVRASTLERLPKLLRPKLAELLAPWYASRGLAVERRGVASDEGVPPFVPWTVAGAGGALALVGGALAGVGALPWLTFETKANALRSLEGEGPSTLSQARTLYAEQERARSDWEGWGGPLIVGGAVTLGLGLVTALSGVTWALLSPGGASE